MRIAIISDIHGNLVALETILTDLNKEHVDQIVCLGDVAITGPQPREVIEQLKALNCPVVMGNCDAWLLDPQPYETKGDSQWIRILEIELWDAQQLSSADLDYVRMFQPTAQIPLGEGTTLLCFHGSPKSNTDIIVSTTSDEELERMLSGFHATVMAGGHTHVQMIRRYKGSVSGAF